MNDQQNFGVFIRSTYMSYGEKKPQWQRIGTAFKNDEQSFNIVLNTLPLPEPYSGVAKLYIRPTKNQSKSAIPPNSYTLFDMQQETH